MPIKRNPTPEEAEIEQRFAVEPPGIKRPVDPTTVDEFIERSPAEFAKYARMVKENPAGAVRQLMFRDMLLHKNLAHLIAIQVPKIRAMLDTLPPAEQERIKEKVESVHEYFRDRTLVESVKAYVKQKQNAETNRMFMPDTKPGTRVSA
jgi:hypothetical protein